MDVEVVISGVKFVARTLKSRCRSPQRNTVHLLTSCISGIPLRFMVIFSVEGLNYTLLLLRTSNRFQVFSWYFIIDQSKGPRYVELTWCQNGY